MEATPQRQGRGLSPEMTYETKRSAYPAMAVVGGHRKRFLTLIKEQTIAEFRLRDQDSILGFAWTLLHPILVFIILYAVFSQWTGRHIENFAAYLLVGIVQWNFFANATTIAVDVLLRRRHLVTNISFPKETLVISSILCVFLSHLIELTVLIGLLFFFGMLKISLGFLLLPVILMVQFALVLGLSFFLSASYLFLRDLDRIWRILVMLGFFVTPIFYPVSVIGESVRGIVLLNPLTHILSATRTILLHGGIPSLDSLCLILLFCLAVLALTYAMFKRLEGTFAEMLGSGSLRG